MPEKSTTLATLGNIDYHGIYDHLKSPRNAQAFKRELDGLLDSGKLETYSKSGEDLKRFAKAVCYYTEIHHSHLSAADNMGMLSIFEFLTVRAESLPSNTRRKRHILMDAASICNQMWQANVREPQTPDASNGAEEDFWLMSSINTANRVLNLANENGDSIDSYHTHIFLYKLGKIGVADLTKAYNSSSIDSYPDSALERLYLLLGLLSENLIQAYYTSINNYDRFVTEYVKVRSIAGAEDPEVGLTLVEDWTKYENCIAYLATSLYGSLKEITTCGDIFAQKVNTITTGEQIITRGTNFGNYYRGYLLGAMAFTRLVAVLEAEYLTYNRDQTDRNKKQLTAEIQVNIARYDSSAEVIKGIFKRNYSLLKPYIENNLIGELTILQSIVDEREGANVRLRLAAQMSSIISSLNGKLTPGKSDKLNSRSRKRR